MARHFNTAGPCKRELHYTDGTLEVANPIYREIVARDLAATLRTALPPLAPTWLRADGSLDYAALPDRVAVETVQGDRGRAVTVVRL